MDSTREQLQRHRREAERLEQRITTFKERDNDMARDKLTYTEALVEVTTALRYVEKRLDGELARVAEDIGGIRAAVTSTDEKVQKLAELRMQNQAETAGAKDQIKRLWWAFGIVGTGLLTIAGLIVSLLRP